MKLNKCPKCGANLDPCERCDCEDEQRDTGTEDVPENEKEKGSHHANAADPRENSPMHIIALAHEKCNSPLRYIRKDKQVPAREIVRTVQERYRKYDKTLQSKCERGDEYGVELRYDVFAELIRKYAPELIVQTTVSNPKRTDNHRLQCRIQCRLETEAHAALMAAIKADGFTTVQEWLSEMVSLYLAKKANIKRD